MLFLAPVLKGKDVGQEHVVDRHRAHEPARPRRPRGHRRGCRWRACGVTRPIGASGVSGSRSCPRRLLPMGTRVAAPRRRRRMWYHHRGTCPSASNQGGLCIRTSFGCKSGRRGSTRRTTASAAAMWPRGLRMTWVGDVISPPAVSSSIGMNRSDAGRRSLVGLHQPEQAPGQPSFRGRVSGGDRSHAAPRRSKRMASEDMSAVRSLPEALQ